MFTRTKQYRLRLVLVLASALVAAAIFGATPAPAHAASLFVFCEPGFGDFLCEATISPSGQNPVSVTWEQLSGGGSLQTSGGPFAWYFCYSYTGTSQFRATTVYEGSTLVRNFSLRCNGSF